MTSPFKQLIENVLTERYQKIDSSQELSDTISKAQDKEKSVTTVVNGKKVMTTGDNPKAKDDDFNARIDSQGNELNTSSEKSLHKIALLNSGVKGKKGKLDFQKSDVETKIGK